jgi:hypothetical protein
MDEKYLSELWNWTNSQDPTFKDRYTFDSWSNKLKSNEGYKKQFYGWVSGIDETFEERRPYSAWSEMVSADKKKEESALFSREGGTLSATPGTGEVGLSGFTRGSRYDDMFTGYGERPQKEADKDPTLLKSKEEIKRSPTFYNPSLQKLSGTDIEQSIEKIDDELIKSTEELVVPKLNYLFGSLGFKFEESSWVGDAVLATAPNGKTKEFDLDVLYGAGAESSELRQWISDNTVSKSNDIAALDADYKKAYTVYENNKQVESEIKNLTNIEQEINNDVKSFAVLSGSLEKQRAELESVPEGERDANWVQKATEFEKKRQEASGIQKTLQEKYDTALERKKNLDRSIGKYVEYQSQLGTAGGVLFNSWWEGTGRVLSQSVGSALDLIVEFSDVTENLDYKERVIAKAKDLGYYNKIESLVREGAELNENQLRAALGNDLDKVNAAIKDDIKKQTKYSWGTLDLARKTPKEILGFDVSEAYEQKFKEGFWGGALSGMISSLPSLLGGPGGSPMRVAKMFLLTSDFIDEEMANNPAFEGVSENEKFKVKGSIGIISAVLEEFGLRNVLAQKGIMSSILMRVLNKTGSNTGTRAFADVVRNEVKSMAARGLLTAGAAGAAEFETGVLQRVAEIEIKDYYNKIKEKDLFKNLPKDAGSYIKDVLYSGAQETVGGFVLSTPVAVSAAYRKRGFEGMSDKDFTLFSAMANDDVIEKAFVADLKNKVNNKVIGLADAKKILNDYRNSRSLYSSLPEGLSIQDKKKAMNLLSDRRQIEESIKGKDESLTKKQRAKIESITQQLEELSNAVQGQTTSEVAAEEEIDIFKLGDTEYELGDDGKWYNAETLEEIDEETSNKVKAEAKPSKKIPKRGSKGTIAGVKVTYPTMQEARERRAARNEAKYVEDSSENLEEENTDVLAEDLQGEFGILTAENPMAQPLTEEENRQLNEKAEEWLKEKGYKPRRVTGKYGQAENSFFVKGLTKEDAIAFAKKFNQDSVAHSEGLLYQDGAMNKRVKSEDNFTFEDFTPESNFVSVIKTKDGLKTFEIGYDTTTKTAPETTTETGQQQTLAAEQGTPTTIEGTGLRENIKKSIAKVFKSVAVKSFKNAKEMAAYAKAKFNKEIGDRDSARVFVSSDGKVEVLVNEELADDTALGHEVWHALLLKAFGDNQAKFAEFRNAIDKTLRQNGYEDIAENLKEFASRYKKDEVPAEEYLAQLGGMMTSAKIDLKNLDKAQRTLLEQIKDIINDFAIQLTGQPVFLKEATPETILDFMSTMSDMMAKGEDISGFFEGGDKTKGTKTRAQIDPRLSELGVEVDKKEKLPQKITPANESKVLAQVDNLLNTYPKALTDNNQWKELMSRVFSYKGPNGEVMIPKFPTGLSRMSSSVSEVLKELSKVSEKQRDLASSGLKGTKEIGKLYKEGKMDEADTGLYFLWNIMSIGISPYPQEAGFLRAVNNGIDSFIKKSADGKFLTGKEIDYNGDKIDSGLAEYFKWVDETLPKGVAGSSSKPNLRSFGSAFLSKASTKIESGEFAGLTKMQALHEILSDKTTPTNELRRKWLANLSGMSFNNKIFDFILLTTGRSDLFVIDRVRTEHFWDSDNLKKESGLKPATSIYDGSELIFGNTKGAGYSKMLSNVSGMVFAELANRTMQPVVQEAYRKIGVTNNPDVGRFHWETWVAASSQEVSHGSIDAIVQRKKSGEITDAGIRQGKYGAWDFNFAYKKRSGKDFVYEFIDEEGNTYVFDDISEIYEEISNQNTKKGYKDNSERFILKDEKGNIIKRKTEKIDNAWYDQYGVNKQKYFEYLKDKAKEFIPAPNVVEDQGVVIKKEPEVKTRAQKTLPDNVAKRLTEDGNGNYVFHHYSRQQRDKILPSTGSGSLFTSREEQAALSSIGGMAMYYAQNGQKEAGVGNELHTIVIPKDKIYYMNEDVLDFFSQGKEEFLKYMNRGRPREKWTQFAFEPNYQVAFITKIAIENGFEMVVNKWRNDVDFRAQTTLTLKPEKENIPFKKSDSKIDVGDKVFVFGQEGLITEINENGVARYTAKSSAGRINIKESQQFRPGEITLLEKGPFDFNRDTGEFTTRAQKAQPQTIPGYDRMIGEVQKIVDKSKKRGVSAAQIVENVINYIQKSRVYERADDLQREQIIRDARKDLGLRQKSAPRVDRVLGIKDSVSTEDKKNLMEVIKAQVKATKNLVKAQKEIAKQINKEIRELKEKGKITTSQMIAALRRLSEVDLLNEESVSNFLDYIARVFKDAAYYERVTNINRKRRAARNSASTKIGIADGLTPLLQKIFSIDARTIPEKALDAYEELVNMFADRSRVLQLSDIENVTNMAQKVFEAVEGEVERARSLAEVLSNYENMATDENGNIEFSKTVDQMVNDGSISAEDGELMKKYKSMILEEAGLKKEKDVRSEEEIEEERQQLVETVRNYTPVFFQLPTQDERNVAREIFRLIKTGAIDKMSNKDLKDLLRIIDNIERGFLPHSAQIMKERMNQINNGETLSEAVNNAKMLPAESRYAKIKALFGGSAIRKAIDRNPLFFIDELFGNFKSTPIFDSIFKPISRAFSSYQSEVNTINRKIQNAMDELSNSLGKNPNKVQFAKQKIMAYMLESEYQANPNSKEVRSAKDFLDATIKYAEETEQNSYSEKDIENLKKIRDEFFSGETIDLDAMLESFSPAEKKAIKTISDINNELATKVAFTSAIIRGRKVGALNNYIHHNTLGERSAADIATEVSMADVFNASMKPSTKAKSLIERTGAATPLVFDPFSSTTRGARQLLMDYHLTEPIRTARRTVKYAESKVTGKQKRILNAISGALEQALSNTLINTYHETTFVEDAIRYMEQTGYRAMLGSIPRAVAELTSNLSYVMLYDPASFKSGISKYRSVAMSEAGLSVMKNVKSQQTERLYPASKLSGRGLDKEVMSQASGIKAGKSRNDVVNAMTVIYNYSGKQVKNVAEATADALIGSPDKAIMKPLWFGAFASEFKKATGQDVDYDKIANNNEAYLTEFSEAIDQAAQHADETSVRVGASDNPFTGILKGANAANQSAMKQAFNKFNNFMSRFLIYEYTTARTGVYALMGSGKLTQKQGAAILGATMSRMIVYSLLSKELVSIMMGMLGFGDDEEDEKTFFQKLGQATGSALSGLILGRNFGNFTKAPINIGVEKVNEKFLDFLREGDYDPYEDAIQYTIIPKDERKKGDIMEYVKSFSGAFSPMIGTMQRTLEVAARDPKTQAAQERRLRELSTRTPLEILGNTGYIPLYRDVRKIVMESLYEDMRKEKKGSGSGGIKTSIDTKIK